MLAILSLTRTEAQHGRHDGRLQESLRYGGKEGRESIYYLVCSSCEWQRLTKNVDGMEKALLLFVSIYGAAKRFKSDDDARKRVWRLCVVNKMLIIYLWIVKIEP